MKKFSQKVSLNLLLKYNETKKVIYAKHRYNNIISIKMQQFCELKNICYPATIIQEKGAYVWEIMIFPVLYVRIGRNI